MEQITITRKTAMVALRNLWEHYSDIWELDAETRAGIAALDELATLLGGDDLLHEWEMEQRERNQQMQAEYEARKAALAAEAENE